jgi:hypothetical protein
VPPQTAANDSSPAPQHRRERNETKRLLKGRLIAPPTFHPNPKTNALIGEFRIAAGSKTDPERTEFVKVSCFDNPQTERFVASRLRDLVDAGALATGTRLTAVGWEHPLVRHGKRVGTQLYATVIKPTAEEKQP